MSSPEARLLNVSSNADLDEIKRAYRKAALKAHPDQNPDPSAARHFRRLTEAYRLLSEQAQRPVPTARRIPTAQRIEFLLLDVRALLRRWPEERWSKPVDGLPARVWVASSLEVLGKAWPYAGAPTDRVSATTEDLIQVVDAWLVGMKSAPATEADRTLQAVIERAEQRLRALERPARSSRS